MDSVTVWSRGKAGETYKVALRGIRPAKGRIEVSIWSAGRSAHAGPPDTVRAYDLYDIWFEPHGDMKCQVDLPGPFDTGLTCRLERGTGTGARIKIWVGLASHAYPLSAADFAELGRFLVPATFA